MFHLCVVLTEKSHEYFEKLLSDSNCQIERDFREVIESYCRLVERISRAPDDVGKDGRFQLFVCIGVRCCAKRRRSNLCVCRVCVICCFLCRDHKLQRYINLISRTMDCFNMYEERSFLRLMRLM